MQGSHSREWPAAEHSCARENVTYLQLRTQKARHVQHLHGLSRLSLLFLSCNPITASEGMPPADPKSILPSQADVSKNMSLPRTFVAVAKRKRLRAGLEVETWIHKLLLEEVYGCFGFKTNMHWSIRFVQQTSHLEIRTCLVSSGPSVPLKNNITVRGQPSHLLVQKVQIVSTKPWAREQHLHTAPHQSAELQGAWPSSTVYSTIMFPKQAVHESTIVTKFTATCLRVAAWHTPGSSPTRAKPARIWSSNRPRASGCLDMFHP